MEFLTMSVQGDDVGSVGGNQPWAEEQNQMDPVLFYVLNDILRLPETSVIYSQDGATDLLDLVTMTKAEIEAITAEINGEMRTITKREARLLVQFTWWHNDLSSQRLGHELSDEIWYDMTKEDFDQFR